MKLLFASDSFKGTISSEQTVEFLTKAAHEVFGPCETIGVPVADGGEGTTDAVILARKGVSVVHNPTSNMKLGSGFADVEKLLKKGINVSLGTDGAASNNNLDMLEEMHLASVIHNGFRQNATIMGAPSVIKMATLNGAALQGRDLCGNIEKGYKADFVVFSTDSPNMLPCLDPVALIVYSAGRSDVYMTVCDGQVIYENGEYKTIDKEKVYFNVRKAVDRLY